jgi:hypothetical protein
VFGLPHATYFNSADNTSFDVVGNTEGSTIYFEHEKGTDEALATGVNTITSNIESGDFDITQKSSNWYNKQVLQHLEEMVNTL